MPWYYEIKYGLIPLMVVEQAIKGKFKLVLDFMKFIANVRCHTGIYVCMKKYESGDKWVVSLC